MVELFQGETDRGAAVLAGSYVENFLGLYLESLMVDQSLTEKVFGSNGSLSTFSQRIDFAQGFGFLNETLCAELQLIRKIRNHFAHHPKDASFMQSPVREWVGSLKSAQQVTFKDGGRFELGDPKLAYLMSAGMFVVLASNKMQRPRSDG